MSNPDQSPANSPLQARALELHTKASMPMSQAEELALSELGIDDAAIDELSAEACCTVLLTLLDAEDVRTFTRAVLVHQPAATSTQAVAPTEAAAMAATVPEMHEALCPALIGDDCTCAKYSPTVDKAWAQFCAGIGDGPNAPYPGMIAAFERYYSQSFADKAWRSEAATWAAAWKAAKQAPVAGQPAEPSPALACGHQASLMLKSAETGEPLYCELCDAQSGRRDAETMEAELRQKLAAMEASQDVCFSDMQFAPIDGTYVLLHMPTCAEKFVVGRWHGYPDSTSGDWGDGCGTYYTYKPEGWMALDLLERLAAPKGDSNG